jgi:hypothetical protein
VGAGRLLAYNAKGLGKVNALRLLILATGRGESSSAAMQYLLPLGPPTNHPNSHLGAVVNGPIRQITRNWGETGY